MVEVRAVRVIVCIVFFYYLLYHIRLIYRSNITLFLLIYFIKIILQKTENTERLSSSSWDARISCVNKLLRRYVWAIIRVKDAAIVVVAIACT